MADDLNIGIRVTANADGIALADRVRAALVALRAEMARPVDSSAFAAEQDALKTNLQLELDLINESVAQKVASEEAGNRQRLAALQRFTEQARALSQSFSAPVQGPTIPQGFLAGAGAGLSAQPSGIAATATTDAAALKSVTINGIEYRVTLQQLNAAMAATNGELTQLEAELKRVTQAEEAAAAGTQPVIAANKQLAQSAEQADVAIQRVPIGARRGANALSTLAFASAGMTTSLRSVTFAMGAAATGIAQLSSSVRIASAASGIGALVVIISTIIGLLEDWELKNKKVKDSLAGLGDIPGKGLQVLLDANQRQIDAMTAQIQTLNRVALNFKGPVPIGFKFPIDEANKALEALFAEREKLTQQFQKTATKDSDQIVAETRRANEESLRIEVETTRGKLASQILALDQALQHDKESFALRGQTQTEYIAFVAAKTRERNDKVKELEQKNADEIADLEAKFFFERKEALAKASGDDFGARRAAADKAFLVETDAIRKRSELPKVEQNLIKEAAGVRDAQFIDIEKERAQKVLEINEGASAQLLTLSGETSQGLADRTRKQFADQIRVLNAAIASPDVKLDVKQLAQKGLDVINAIIPVEVAKGRIAELEQAVSEAGVNATQQLAQTSALVETHTIGEREARRQIVQALIEQRDVIASSIPLLEEEAANLPGAAKSDAIAKIRALETELIQLNLRIQETSDEFFRLKETARDSATSALAGFIEGVSQLGRQDLTEVHAFAAEVSSARQELEGLLAIPASQRTSLQNQRITELRGEIEQTTVALDNAKHAITTWQQLFLDAAKSIVDALIKVASQMLATQAIESLFGFFGGPSGDNPAMDAILAAGIPGVQVTPGHAAGGLIRGPGTGTSDSIPARLSAGEFVIRAAVVDQVGPAFLHALNTFGDHPVTRIRRDPFHFAEGGLVTPLVRPSDASAPASPTSAHHLRVSLAPGLVLETLKTSEGHRAVVEVVADNANGINAALGR